MSDMIVSAGVPEVALGNTAPIVVGAGAGLSDTWDGLALDIAKSENLAQPAQPVQPQAVVTEVKVQPVAPVVAAVAPVVAAVVAPVDTPEKFRDANGGLDQDKLLKSYFEAEKGLKRLQNGAQAQTPTPQVQQPQANPQQPQGQLNPFELQVAQDLFQGGGYTEQQAISQARVLVKLEEARHQALTQSTLSEVNQFREMVNQQQTRNELSQLAAAHPEVLTPKGHAELVKVREENPWLNNSPEPWKAATMYLLGQKALGSGKQGQVTPIPMGGQQSAQPLPVTPAPVSQQPVRLNSQAEILEHLKTLNPKQEDEFWKANGLKMGITPAYNHVLG